MERREDVDPRTGAPVRVTGHCRQAMIHEGRFLQSDFMFEQGEEDHGARNHRLRARDWPVHQLLDRLAAGSHVGAFEPGCV